MIFVGESTDAIRREAVRGGMRTLRQDALTKVLEGISTVEELLRVTPNESQE
jgi:type II secretory ATPase GspE/PulE/Tfp pilus assembly ATPase PilB-like protein